MYCKHSDMLSTDALPPMISVLWGESECKMCLWKSFRKKGLQWYSIVVMVSFVGAIRTALTVALPMLFSFGIDTLSR